MSSPVSNNLLDMVPVRHFTHQLNDDRVVVLIPKYRSRWLGWLQKRLKRPYYRLRLDDVGSMVWLSCDGEKTVADIGDLLQKHFGQKVEPVWDRLGLFVQQMRKGRLIGWKE
jgi:hypothetical protein